MRRGLSTGGLGIVLVLAAGAPAVAGPTSFEVTFTPGVRPEPISARVYVMLGRPGDDPEPRQGPDWFDTQPFFAVEAQDWKPGEALSVGADALGFPGPITELQPGRYVAQAVVRLNPDTHRLGDGEGNAYSAPVCFRAGGDGPDVVRLRVDRVVPPRRLRESEHLKLVDIPSPLLSAFHRRPIRHRAAVVLPEGLAAGATRPTLYVIPGFGGSAFGVREGGGAPYGRDCVRVVLDPDCGTGHHVFADSATNGPRGRALIEELIPFIEAAYPVIPDPRRRLLTGHSSGGWSSLWLQVSHPDTFGGAWSTSPDPVDFRDFQGIDLYASDANLFRDRCGHRRPLAREGMEPVLWFDRFSRMEDVLGLGGQLHSFEAVFSPLGRDGQPRPLWDRGTGALDPEVARAWQAYDLRLVLERNWDTLGPRLRGKLHIFTGALDTFYLEGAVRRLKTALAELGSDAEVRIMPGKDHSNLLDASLIEHIDREMHEALGQAGERPR